MVILFGFYHEDKKISYLIALFCVNIFQWIILIYSIFNNPTYIKTDVYYLVGAPLFTLVLANQIRINHLKTKISIQIDKIKLILLVTGLIIIIGSLTGFIVYYAPIFLYGITLGLMAFTYGFYHGDKKVNISERNNIANTLTKNVNITRNYVGAMVSFLILQFFILIYFSRQFSVDDLSAAFTFSVTIGLLLSIQIYRSNLTISNEKKENIIGICAILAFIVFFGILALK